MSLTGQRDPLFKAIYAFEYIGTKKEIREPEKAGDVFLSTNFEDAPILIHNWANDGGGLGWQGSVIIEILFVIIIGFLLTINL